MAVALLSVFCLAMPLAACGGGGEDEEPTGTTGKIAFTSHRDGNNEIYVMNTDGSGLTRLTHDPAVDGLPAWSPYRERAEGPWRRNGERYAVSGIRNST